MSRRSQNSRISKRSESKINNNNNNNNDDARSEVSAHSRISRPKTPSIQTFRDSKHSEDDAEPESTPFASAGRTTTRLKTAVGTEHHQENLRRCRENGEDVDRDHEYDDRPSPSVGLRNHEDDERQIRPKTHSGALKKKRDDERSVSSKMTDRSSTSKRSDDEEYDERYERHSRNGNDRRGERNRDRDRTPPRYHRIVQKDASCSPPRALIKQIQTQDSSCQTSTVFSETTTTPKEPALHVMKTSTSEFGWNLESRPERAVFPKPRQVKRRALPIVTDPSRDHNITFEFPALRWHNDSQVDLPRAIVIEFEFFGFPEVVSSRLLMTPADRNEEVFLLSQEDANGLNGTPKFDFNLNPQKLSPHRPLAFHEYLRDGKLSFRVLDADSLLSLGGADLEMDGLLKDKSTTKLSRELLIKGNEEMSCDSRNPIFLCDPDSNVDCHTVVCGALQVVITDVSSQCKDLIPSAVRSAGDGQGHWRVGGGASSESTKKSIENGPHHRVRASPMFDEQMQSKDSKNVISTEEVSALFASCSLRTGLASIPMLLEVFRNQPGSALQGPVAKKIQEALKRAQDNRRFDLTEAFAGLDPSDSRDIGRAQIEQLLMQIGLEMTDHAGQQQQQQPSAGVLSDDDSLQARQWKRLQRIRNKSSSLNPIIPPNNNINNNRDATPESRLARLQQIKSHRETNKRARISQLLWRRTTHIMNVRPTFGETVFVEWPVRNSQGTVESFHVRCHDPEIRVISNGEELSALQGLCGDCWPSGDNNNRNDNQIKVPTKALQGGRLSMSPGEETRVPLAFLSFNQKPRTVDIELVSVSQGRSLQTLRVVIDPRKPIVDRSVTVYADKDKSFRRECVLAAPEYHKGDVFLHCHHPRTAIEWGESSANALCNNNGGVSSLSAGGGTVLKCHLMMAGSMSSSNNGNDHGSDNQKGSDKEDVHLLLYSDPYHCNLLSCVRLEVRFCEPVAVVTTLGGVTSLDLKIRPGSRGMLTAVSNDNRALKFYPSVPFPAVTGSVSTIQVQVRGNKAGTISRLLQLIHRTTSGITSVHQQWLLTAVTNAPASCKTFDIHLPIGAQAHKRISYRNHWPHAKHFYLFTSDSKILRLKEPSISIPPNQDGFLRLWFAPQNRQMSDTVYVFINNEDNQMEECLQFIVVCTV
eukprot:TRINITY_DN266_c3_g1_i1.p1 TRINITY_DN266_c3_g1~~TRINITY_DN266_c3_g1_i1.p1  ORF type:complete len:1175 (+),score=317.60 TRINITY_DN266_c3_g1_i1:70-3525(+)